VTERHYVARRLDGIRLTERDHALLAFAAEHRLVLERQLELLIGARHRSLRARLDEIVRRGYMSVEAVFNERHYQIRSAGLAALGSGLPAPRFKLGAYNHDVGLAWLWLAAHKGAFGPLREILSERRLRSHDGALERPHEPYGVRLGGFDRRGNERLHYPDLLVTDPSGRRLALELELTPKGRERRELILGGYGTDSRIDRVLYLVEANRGGAAIRRALEDQAREMGLSNRVRFQPVKPFCVPRVDPAPARCRSPERSTHLRADAQSGR
jgi:hypothetical protein